MAEKKVTGDNLVDTILKRTAAAHRKVNEWNIEAKEDIAFTLGEQWTPEERESLKGQNRPCLTFNKMEMYVDLVSGHQRSNSSRIKVNPEGGEDQVFSDCCDKALNHIDKVSSLTRKLNAQFDGGLMGGKSYIEGVLSYDKDPVFGELNFLDAGPFMILKDPSSVMYDLSDCEYMMKVRKYNKTKLIAMFPEKENIIKRLQQDIGITLSELDIQKETDADNYDPERNKGTDLGDASELPTDKKFTLIEYWHKKYLTKYCALDVKTEKIEQFDDEDEADAFADSQNEIMPEANIKSFKKKIPEMHYVAMVCKKILENAKSPFEPQYSGFPFFPFLAKYRPFAENEVSRVKGISRNLKDPQREVNKSHSQMLHLLQSAGWVGDESALSPTQWKELKDKGSSPNLILKIKKKEARLEKIPIGEPSQLQLLREKSGTESFKEVTGINPDLLAMEDKTTSGRALSIRIKQGLTILSGIFDNFKWTKEIIGKFILQMIPNMMDAKKWARILGPDYMMKTAYQGVALSEGHLEAFLQQIKDHKYDLSVSEADDTPTIRAEVFDKLVQLVEAGMAVPTDMIIEYSGIPHSSEVKARVQAEEQRQMQMAQMEATQKAAQRQTPRRK